MHIKTSLNFSALFKEILYLGVNLNIHKLEYHSDQKFFESGQNPSSPVYNIDFENGISSYGEGASAQIGAILKLKKIRIGLTYNSTQYIDIIDETKQTIFSNYIEQGLSLIHISEPTRPY